MPSLSDTSECTMRQECYVCASFPFFVCSYSSAVLAWESIRTWRLCWSTHVCYSHAHQSPHEHANIYSWILIRYKLETIDVFFSDRVGARFYHCKPEEFGSYYTGINSRPRVRTAPGPTTLFSNQGNK